MILIKKSRLEIFYERLGFILGCTVFFTVFFLISWKVGNNIKYSIIAETILLCLLLLVFHLNNKYGKWVW